MFPVTSKDVSVPESYWVACGKPNTAESCHVVLVNKELSLVNQIGLLAVESR